MMTIMTLMAILSIEPFSLKPKLKLAPLPETEGFLMGASSAVIGRDGSFYVLDVAAAKVYVWKANGTFSHSFGGKGEGPGEFNFKPFEGLFGYLDVLDDTVLVYDAALKRTTSFDGEGKVIRVQQIKAPPGSIYNFYVTGKDRFVLDIQDRSSELPMRHVAAYDFNGERIDTFLEVADETFERVINQGKEVGVIFKIYEAGLATSFNADKGILVYGIGDQSRLQMMNLKTGSQESLAFTAKRRPVTAEDIAEHQEIRWIKNSAYFSATYAEYMPYFNQIYALKDHTIVANVSPYYRKVSGTVLDAAGKSIGTLNIPLGESGNLFCSRGQLLLAGLDEAGEVFVKLMELTNPAGTKVGLK